MPCVEVVMGCNTPDETTRAAQVPLSETMVIVVDDSKGGDICHDHKETKDYEKDPDPTDDESSLSVQSDTNGSVDQITNCATLDEIEEAWDDMKDSGELTLSHLSLDLSAINLLLEKAAAPKMHEHRNAPACHKVLLEDCSFSSAKATNRFIHFLNQIAPHLKEVFIVDTYKTNSSSADERTLSLLPSLPTVAGLERLAVDRADLRGKSIGRILKTLLASAPRIQTLRLNDCHINNQTLKPFLEGIQRHDMGILHLDLDGWYMNDRQLERLAHALVASPSAKTIRFLDLSRSDITVQSFKTLTMLIQQLTALEELVLMDCKHLFAASRSDRTISESGRESFLEFAQDIKRNTHLQELRLDGAPDDMARLLVDAQTESTCLHALDLRMELVNLIPLVAWKMCG